jgi:hypothetical protein
MASINSGSLTPSGSRKRRRRHHQANRTAIWNSDDDDDNDHHDHHDHHESDSSPLPQSKRTTATIVNPTMERRSPKILLDDDDDSSSDSDDEDELFLKRVTQTSPTFQKRTANSRTTASPRPRVSLLGGSERKQQKETKKKKGRSTLDAELLLRDSSSEEEDASSSSSSVNTTELARRLHKNVTSSSQQQQESPYSSKQTSLRTTTEKSVEDEIMQPTNHPRDSVADEVIMLQEDEEEGNALLVDPRDDDDLSADGDDDTVELSRRLKTNLGHHSTNASGAGSLTLSVAASVSSPVVPNEIATHQSPGVISSNQAASRSSGSLPLVLDPPRGRFLHTEQPSEEDEDEALSSEGEESTDTTELARRLSKKFGLPTNNGVVEDHHQSRHHRRSSPSSLQRSPPCSSMLNERNNFGEDDDIDDCLDEDFDSKDDDDDDDDQSADTAELGLRLQVKLCRSNKASSDPSMPPADDVLAEIRATTSPTRLQPNESSSSPTPGQAALPQEGETVQFWLPSQSDSSSDDDDDDESGEEENGNADTPNEREDEQRPPYPSTMEKENTPTKFARSAYYAATEMEEEEDSLDPRKPAASPTIRQRLPNNAQLKRPPPQQQTVQQLKPPPPPPPPPNTNNSKKASSNNPYLRKPTASPSRRETLLPKNDAPLKPPPPAPQQQNGQADVPPSNPYNREANPYLRKAPASNLDSPRKMPARQRGNGTTNNRMDSGRISEHNVTANTWVPSPQRNHDQHWSQTNHQRQHGANHHQDPREERYPNPSSSGTAHAARVQGYQFYPEEASPPNLYEAAFGGTSPPHQEGVLAMSHGRLGTSFRPAEVGASNISSSGVPVAYEDAFGSISPPHQYATFDNNNNDDTSWRRHHQQGGTHTTHHAMLGRNHQPTNISENNHRDIIRTEEELYNGAFGETNGRPIASTSNGANFVVLVDSDSDDDGDTRSNHPMRPTEASLVHSGLRTERRSPRFNIVSRAFPKRQDGTARAARDQPASDIEDFSDEDNYNGTYRPSRKVARRVTEDHSTRLRQQRPRRLATMGNTSTTAIPIDDSLDATAPNNMEDNSSAPSTGASGLARPWRRSQKPRLRDAVASNPFNAGSVAPRRKMQQQPLAFPPPPGRFGTSTVDGHRQRIQDQRNDIHGGSGVGAGGFAYVDNRKHDDNNDGDESIDRYDSDGGQPAPRRATRKPAAKKTAARGRKKGRGGGAAKKTSRKKKTGGKRGGGSGRGRGRKGSGGGRGSWGGQRRGNAGGGGGAGGGVWGDDNDGGHQVSEAFTREDPAMQNIGGAEIVF